MQDDWVRIARYLSGECTPTEAEATRRWIDDNPERQRMVETLSAGWAVAPKLRPTSTSGWNTRAAWQRFTARKRTREGRLQLGIVRPVAARRSGWPRWAAASIAAAAILAVGGLWWQRGAEEVVAPRVQLREIRTVAGQRALLTLGDGSRVVLGPASVLRYDSTKFGATSRTLDLEGEAYFTVAHMPQTAPPFLVRTRRGIVRDIGTAFNVRDFVNRGSLEVAVSDGLVMLGDRALERGDLGQVDSAGTLRVRHGVDVDAYIAWTTGRLVFSRTPLHEAIPDLERWYDLDITLADPSMRQRPLVATLYEDTANSALDLLALTLNLRVERKGRAVTLYPIN